ncbi:MAG TPA: cysteine peptidase family C39 domain-containing protein [Candidatus Methanomethylicus sp.]|nr:cysteine peptidase family C39 domain-containing protein [Candidatus Methanomethylicus sp.]
MKPLIVAAVMFVAGTVPMCIGMEVSSVEGMELSQCGVNSLYLCLRYHGIEQRLDELYAQVPADEDGNVSLKQLADYARGKGLHVKAVIKPTVEDVTNVLGQKEGLTQGSQRSQGQKAEDHGQDGRGTREDSEAGSFGHSTRDTSVVLQYAVNMPDKSKFRHIVALVRPEDKVLVMDYPGSAQEIMPEKLAELVSMSEGMLILSTKPLINAAEFLNFKTVKSWSFYAICVGLVMLAGSAVSSLRGRRKA